jgi:CDP-6-deoxy-D-xylo-4-hexulose-3-dehydrase
MSEYEWPLMKETITLGDRMKMARFVLTAKRLTAGAQVRCFEKEWNAWLGSRFSLFVSSGSTANFLLLAAIKEKYGLKDGDKILVPSCTWMTNVAPVIQLGFTPIFCDINLTNFSYDVGHMKRIQREHPDIKVIFVTHLLGLPADNSTYAGIFKNAIIIDDVCESHGVRDENRKKVGSDSIGATFSFYFGHHMTTIEGGMVSTNDHDLYNIMKMKRSHGMSRESEIPEVYASMYPDIDPSFLFITDGYNFRNHEVCAVLGRSQLKRLDGMISVRQNNYKMFMESLDRNKDKFFMPSKTPMNSSFCFPLVAKDKETFNRLKAMLVENSIEHRPVVSGNLLRHPFINASEETIVNFPNANMLHENGLYVGNNHFVGHKQMKSLGEILDAC